MGSFSILPIGTYATSANFHQPRDTTEAVLSYQNTVLQAQQEVEDALASFLGAQASVALLAEAVAAARPCWRSCSRGAARTTPTCRRLRPR